LPKIWTMKLPKFFTSFNKCIVAFGRLDLSGLHCTYFVEFLKEMVLLFNNLMYLPYVHWIQYGFTNSVIFSKIETLVYVPSYGLLVEIHHKFVSLLCVLGCQSKKNPFEHSIFSLLKAFFHEKNILNKITNGFKKIRWSLYKWSFLFYDWIHLKKNKLSTSELKNKHLSKWF